MDIKLFLAEGDDIEIIAYQKRNNKIAFIPVYIGVNENKIECSINLDETGQNQFKAILNDKSKIIYQIS